jgi:MerR family transcriptional regulator, heat shock protein HspR
VKENNVENELKKPYSGREYTIGEAADMLGISIPLLRMYEREGLILPFRRGSKHRRYTDLDLNRVRCIREMITKQKVSIAGIQHLLALIPCWKIRDCPEEARTGCPAFQQHSTPCWMVSNKPWECRNSDCRHCPVYTEFSECHSLKSYLSEFTLDGSSKMKRSSGESR